MLVLGDTETASLPLKHHWHQQYQNDCFLQHQLQLLLLDSDLARLCLCSPTLHIKDHTELSPGMVPSECSFWFDFHKSMLQPRLSRLVGGKYGLS